MLRAFWILLAALFLLPSLLWSQCPGGICRSPIAGKIEWKLVPNADDERAGYLNGVHLGNWHISTQDFTPMNKGQWGERTTDLPIPVPADYRRAVQQQVEPAKDWHMKNGVDMGKVSQRERNSISGKEVSKREAISSLGADVVGDNPADDSTKYWLLIASPSKEVRESVEKAILTSPLMADVKSKIRTWSGEGAVPDHFLMKDRETGKALYPPGEPRIMLIDSTGGVCVSLPRFDEKNSVGVLRKAMPDYDPKLDPDGQPKKSPDGPNAPPGLPLNQTALLGAAVLAALFLYTLHLRGTV